jgi:hypothetical protein
MLLDEALADESSTVRSRDIRIIEQLIDLGQTVFVQVIHGHGEPPAKSERTDR